MPRPGLRLRIAIALALACLLVVGALGFTLYTASEEMENSLIDQILSEEMDFLVERHRNSPAYVPQASFSLQSHIARNPAERALLPDYMHKLNTGRHEIYIGKDEFHVLVRDTGEVRYYVAYQVGLHEQREQEFKLLVVLSVLAATLASLALGYWLSGVLVSQVADLAAQVSKLKPGEARVTLARDGQDPEVATLALAFDNYQASIELMIRREQEFTANAGHELRTPLTAIQTSCELLGADPTLNEKARARVLRISEAAQRMEQQIQALLFLARGQPLGEFEPVALASCVNDAAEPYRGEISRKGLAFEVAIPEDAILNLNHQALRFVVANLIRNAVQYTERGFVTVVYAARCLTIADSGRGIRSEHVPLVFERFFREDGAVTGIGLGLSIVKRVCDHYGWNIEVRSAPMKGSTFSITFP